MLGLNYKLEKLEKAGTPILVGIVGAGQMGQGMVSQMHLMVGMNPSIVADINIENAKKAFINAGITEDKIKCTKNVDESDEWIAQGNYVVTDDAKVITESKKIQVLIEATGVTEVGAKIALDTIMGKKHLVMLNAETDVVIGPL